MNQVWGSKVPLYFETEESQLVLGDSFKILTKMKQESVDMIFADPPYFLSNDGITCQGGKMVSVNKYVVKEAEIKQLEREHITESVYCKRLIFKRIAMICLRMM